MPGIMEATRLTRAGRLAEATALIQRTLRRDAVPPSWPVDETNASESIKPIWRIGVEPAAAVEAPGSATPTDETPATTKTRARRAPASRRFDSSPLMPLDKLPLPGLEGLLGRGLTRPAPADVIGPGQWISGTHISAVGTRSYKLHIPSGYNGQAMPLVVMLHGCTQTPDDFAAGTGMNKVAETEGLLVVYPAQAVASNQSVGSPGTELEFAL